MPNLKKIQTNISRETGTRDSARLNNVGLSRFRFRGYYVRYSKILLFFFFSSMYRLGMIFCQRPECIPLANNIKGPPLLTSLPVNNAIIIWKIKEEKRVIVNCTESAYGFFSFTFWLESIVILRYSDRSVAFSELPTTYLDKCYLLLFFFSNCLEAFLFKR